MKTIARIITEWILGYNIHKSGTYTFPQLFEFSITENAVMTLIYYATLFILIVFGAFCVASLIYNVYKEVKNFKAENA